MLIANKYRLARKLGEGGMGSVWEAHHEHLDTEVAIKVIRSDSNRSELGPRLLLEARAAAKLGHPAIVRVFDVGQTSDGDPFIVMELLRGQSLSALLRREKRLSATEAVRLLLPIADALRAAHAKTIVHRDIKPDNVFLVAEETGIQPKLVDFGIAKFGPHEIDSQLTQPGALVGSPDYMAPEQARGEDDIDRRADIWAFCVVLYETICGRAPFEAANYHALLRAIVELTPPSLASQLSADAELSQIIDTGMAKDRAQRFQSMQELGEALARWLMKQGVFEDASGASIEAKWILRRTDATERASRISLSSIHDAMTTMPGLGSAPTEERRLEPPTSVGPVVTGTSRGAPRRLLVPLAFALAALCALGALSLLRDSQSATNVAVPLPVAASSVATANGTPPVPREARGPTEETSPEEARPSKPSAKPSAEARALTPATKRTRPAVTASAKEPRAAATKQGLDLMAPY